MIKEQVFFKLRLGPDSDRFAVLVREVQRMMAELGVVPGRRWSNVTGEGRWTVLEREFASLAAYEEDDRTFHAGAEFMRVWREMESLAEQMRVELWELRPGPSQDAS